MVIGSIKRTKLSEEIVFDSNLLKINEPFFNNNFVKLAILSILAGYKKRDLIFVNDKFNRNIDLECLGKFISYTLNFNIAPRKYNIKIKHNKNYFLEQEKIANNFLDTILSFSGGIDSTAGLLYSLSKGQNVLPL